ncbi:hypothetical protein BJY52DRAFT_827081 [Lactarius psammicola]|nr:hypothetical protein BJY52DRAFT_827081 [Lactarius psammicola]
MDTQWCLTCNRHLSSDGVYCSSECYNEDNPSTTHSSILDYHDASAISQAGPSSSLWPASNHEGILAWARNVSPGLPSNERTPSPRRPASKPILLNTGMSSRPLAPALSVASSPVLAQPSHPIQTPRSSERPRPSLYRQSAGDFSTTTTSLATDSVATPVSGEDERVVSHANGLRPSQSSVIGAIAKHVRTWVGNTSSRQTPPPKRTPQDPAVAGVDTAPFPLPRSREALSLHMVDDVVLPEKGATTQDESVLAGWLGRPKQPTKPLQLPASRDHPAFRTRGRKTARVYC